MSRAQVVFFTGPGASGKSTTAAAWAASRSKPTAHFDHDDARFLVRGGYVSRTAAHADPSLAEEAERQWLVAATVCESMAATYVEWGFDFALSAFRPYGPWRGMWEAIDALDPLIVVLLPTIESLLARDAQRTGRAQVGETSVRRGYAYDWDGWRKEPNAIVINNTSLTVEEVIALIDRELSRRIRESQTD